MPLYKKQQKQMKNEKRDKDYNTIMEMKKEIEEIKEEASQEQVISQDVSSNDNDEPKAPVRIS